eukprot:scaffold7383_cov65-Phaeocystis_antarctica.AAC.2
MAGTGGACTKSARRAASELPMYLSMTSGPLTIVGGRRERPVARRAARYDLPQPGGPWSSSPLTGSPPSSSSSERGAHSGTQMRRQSTDVVDHATPCGEIERAVARHRRRGRLARRRLLGRRLGRVGCEQRRLLGRRLVAHQLRPDGHHRGRRVAHQF